MTVMAVNPQVRAGTGSTPAKAAGARGAKSVPPAAAIRPDRQIVLGPVRESTSKSLLKLAGRMAKANPEMPVHQHLQDAADQVRIGNEEGALRHLRAAAYGLQPRALRQHGIHDDRGHVAARQALEGVIRHHHLVRDIQDAEARNQANIARQAMEDAYGSPPLPSYGGDPGALAQKPVARQPGGDRAMNAPARANAGRVDANVADPVGPQPRGSKQFAYGWDDLARVVDLTAVPVRAYRRTERTRSGPRVEVVSAHTEQRRGPAQATAAPAAPAASASPDEEEEQAAAARGGVNRSHIRGWIPEPKWKAGQQEWIARGRAARAAREAAEKAQADPERAAVSDAIGKMRQAIQDRVAADQDVPSWESERKAAADAPPVLGALGALQRESAGDATVKSLSDAFQALHDSLRPGLASRGRLSSDPGVGSALRDLDKAIGAQQETAAMQASGIRPDARHIVVESPGPGGSNDKSYLDIRDPESLRQAAAAASSKGFKVSEAGGPPDLSSVPKGGRQLYEHAAANGWNTRLYQWRNSSGQVVHQVEAANPEAGYRAKQVYIDGKRQTYGAGPVSAAMDLITQHPRAQYAEAASDPSARTAADARTLAADIRSRARPGTPLHDAAQTLAGAVKDIGAGRSPVSAVQAARDALSADLAKLTAEREQMERDRAKGRYVMLGDVTQQIDRTQGLLNRADTLLTVVRATRGLGRAPGPATEPAAAAGRLEAAKHAADWMRIGNFEDSRDSQTGYPYSSLSQTADFGATIRGRAVKWTHPDRGRPKPVMTYDWNVGRQRTEREGPDEHGRHWSSYLAEGSAPTMAKAKSEALAKMKELRAAHIAAGGDIGYGDAPTGDEIRAATAGTGAAESAVHQPKGLPPGYEVTFNGKTTWMRSELRNGVPKSVVSHPVMITVRDPEGTERNYDSVSEAVKASQEAHAANQPREPGTAAGPGTTAAGFRHPDTARRVQFARDEASKGFYKNAVTALKLADRLEGHEGVEPGTGTRKNIQDMIAQVGRARTARDDGARAQALRALTAAPESSQVPAAAPKPAAEAAKPAEGWSLGYFNTSYPTADERIRVTRSQPGIWRTIVQQPGGGWDVTGPDHPGKAAALAAVDQVRADRFGEQPPQRSAASIRRDQARISALTKARDATEAEHQRAGAAYMEALRAAHTPGGGFNPHSPEGQEAERLRQAVNAANAKASAARMALIGEQARQAPGAPPAEGTPTPGKVTPLKATDQAEWDRRRAVAADATRKNVEAYQRERAGTAAAIARAQAERAQREQDQSAAAAQGASSRAEAYFTRKGDLKHPGSATLAVQAQKEKNAGRYGNAIGLMAKADNLEAKAGVPAGKDSRQKIEATITKLRAEQASAIRKERAAAKPKTISKAVPAGSEKRAEQILQRMGERTSGEMNAGDWQEGYQAVGAAPTGILGNDTHREIGGHLVRGSFSDGWWMAKPGGGWAISRRWRSKAQDSYSHKNGEFVTTHIPAADIRVLTPVSAKGIALAWAALARAIELAAGPAMTKPEAGYRPGGTPGHRCGDCTMIRGERCTLVRGLIDPDDVCDHFEPREGRAVQAARTWDDLASVIDLSARTPMLEATPAPRGRPGGPGLYFLKGNKHSDYLEQVVKALIEKRGMPPSKAYAIAWGALRRWQSGKGKVHPEVRAAASGALGQEAKAAAAARAAHAHAVTWDDLSAVVELAVVSVRTYQRTVNTPSGPRVQTVTQHMQNYKQGMGQPAASVTAKTVPNAPASQQNNGPPSKAAEKKRLLATAARYRRQAALLQVQENVLNNALMKALYGKNTTAAQAGATTAAQAGATTAAAAPSAAQQATKAATAAGATAAQVTQAAQAATATAANMSAAQLQKAIAQVKARIAWLNAQAAKLTAQAAKL